MSEFPLAASIFETFNAKNLRPDQVAKTFVPSTNFDSLARRRHSIVVGPRGSGKTTLLKMLQPEALDKWSHRESEHYRSIIDFSGVFVPTDRVWKEQIEALSSEGFEHADRLLLGRALFASHVLTRLAQTMQYRCAYVESDALKFRGLTLERKIEAEIVRALAEAWQLDLRIASFKGLVTSLAARKLEIPTFVSQERRRGYNGRAQRIADMGYLHIGFLAAASTGIDIFEQLTETVGDHWAFLFDELELAPAYVVQDLIDGLRGGDERILFKLSMAPYNPDIHMLKDLMSAMPGNDFDFVILWSATKGEGAHDFCRSLLQSMLKDFGQNEAAPESIFGSTEYGNFGELFDKAAASDPGFYQYCQKNGVDGVSIQSITNESKRAEVIRKAVPIVRARLEFRQNAAERKSILMTASYRSRKALPSIYSGANALFDMMEGNPRWFIGVVRPLVEEYIKSGRKVSPQRQAQEISKAISKFIALLRTIPCPKGAADNEPVGVDKALDSIGEYFAHNLHREVFNAEPVGSIIVNSGLRASFVASLGAALNAGALVYLYGPSSEIVLGTLEDRRFRLSFLLCPRYKLPLIVMKAVSLRRILERKGSSIQLCLFEGSASNV